MKRLAATCLLNLGLLPSCRTAMITLPPSRSAGLRAIETAEFRALIDQEADAAILVASKTCSSCAVTESLLSDYVVLTQKEILSIELEDYRQLVNSDWNYRVEKVPALLLIHSGRLKDLKSQRLDEREYLFSFLDRKTALAT